MKKIYVVISILIAIINSFGWVDGVVNITEIQSTANQYWGGMQNYGVQGGTILIKIPSGQYNLRTPEVLTGDLILVIDDNVGDIKKSWIAMILSAQANNKQITFHAQGIGSAYLRPYYLSIK